MYFLAGLTVFIALAELREDFADRFLPLMLGSVALSLLLSSTLISGNLSGQDIHLEYLVFQRVLHSGSWSSNSAVVYNTALSVSILPSIISLITSLDGVVIFKTVYPALYSIVPVILYRIYRRILSPAAATLSVFVFLTYPSSYLEITQLARQMIAELILVLLVCMLFHGSLKSRSSTEFLVTVLTIGLVISHYSIGLIYVFLIAFSYAFSRISDFRSRQSKSGVHVSGTLVAYSLVAAVAWYFLVAAGTVFLQLSVFTGFVAQGMSNFLNPSSRPYQVLDALGVSQVNLGILHLANRAMQYLVVACIVLGLIVYLRRRPKSQIESALMAPMIACIVFILAGVALPYLSVSLNLSRMYQISLVFISPLFYFGAMKITSGLNWLRNFLTTSHEHVRIGASLPVAILFCYLLFTSGWVWAITLDTPTSMVLDPGRMANSSNPNLRFQYYGYYTLSQDIAAVQWIGSHGAAGHSFCADSNSVGAVLTSYGGYERNESLIPYCDFTHHYVFLSVVNSVSGIAETWDKYGGSSLFSLNNTLVRLQSQDRVYSDGASIYEGFT